MESIMERIGGTDQVVKYILSGREDYGLFQKSRKLNTWETDYYLDMLIRSQHVMDKDISDFFLLLIEKYSKSEIRYEIVKSSIFLIENFRLNLSYRLLYDIDKVEKMEQSRSQKRVLRQNSV